MRSWFHRSLARKNRKTFRPTVESLECRLVPSTYYVATTGSNNNNGSINSPFATIQQAANTVQAGDTVIVEAGTYAGFDVETGGTQGAPITFEAAAGATVTINSPDAFRSSHGTGEGINIEDFSNGNPVNYVTIKGFTITGMPEAGIRAVSNGVVNSTGLILEDNTCSNNAVWGIFTSHEDNILIERNTCSNSKQQHGIYVSNACVNPQVIDNVLFGNAGCGLHMNGDLSEGGTGIITGALVEGNIVYNNGTAGGSGINCDGVQNSTIENNLLYDNHASGISLYRGDAAAPANNDIVANNTVIEASDGRWCLNIQSGATGEIIFNNIFLNENPSHGSIDMEGVFPIYSDYNVVQNGNNAFTDGTSNYNLAGWQAAYGLDTHSFTVSSSEAAAETALFVNAGAGNYQLLSTSPAIDKGTASFQGASAPNVDILGNPRPSGSCYDIGAYEYQSAVVQAGTTTALVSSAGIVQAGQSVTFTATVSSGTAGTITGTVTFEDGSTTLGTGTLSNGQATFTTSSLAVGSHSITAVYSGDTNYAGSTSSALTQTVNPATSTTSLSTSRSSLTYGQSVTFTATVASATGIAATGTVTFQDGSTTLGTGTLSNDQATFSTSSLTAGSHTITAVYGGSSTVSGSTSISMTQTVTQASSSTALSTSAATVAAGQAVTFTASVTSSAGTLTGAVTFEDGSTVLGSGTISGGQATFTTSSLSVGSHSITAVYGGDNNFAGSTSSNLTETVTAVIAGTSTALTSSTSTAQAGQSVTFTATVSSGTAGTITGTVTFKDGSTTLGAGTVSNGQAIYSTSSLSVGSHSITGAYSGDTNYSGSTSSALTQTVNPATSTTSLSTSSSSLTYGQSVTFTATVASATGIAATGTVTFQDGSTTLGTGTLSNGQATYSTSSLAAGSHTITAVYGGSSNVSGSTSSGANVTVAKASTTAKVTASASTITVGQAVTFTVTVASTTSGTPTGTVTFKNGSTTLGTATLVKGQASLTTSSLRAGSHTITAVYGGNANFKTSTSPGVTVTVKKATTATTLAASPTSVTSGQSVTLAATVSSRTAGTITGIVTFKNGWKTLGTARLSGGRAIFRLSSLAVGRHRIEAVYDSDSTFAGSTSAIVMEIVT